MFEARTKRVFFGLLMAALLVGSGQVHAERIFFTNGRSMSIKDYHVAGDTITVGLRGGGTARFEASLVARIVPDEVPEVDASLIAAAERTHATPIDARPFAALIEAVSLKHGVDPDLVHAVVLAESNYQPTARSQVGARGLMQVMPSTGADFGIKNLYDPQSNLEAGVQYLKFLLTRFNLTQAIAAYNAGPAMVRKYRGIPPFPETRSYVKKVLANFQR